MFCCPEIIASRDSQYPEQRVNRTDECGETQHISQAGESVIASGVWNPMRSLSIYSLRDSGFNVPRAAGVSSKRLFYKKSGGLSSFCTMADEFQQIALVQSLHHKPRPRMSSWAGPSNSARGERFLSKGRPLQKIPIPG